MKETIRGIIFTIIVAIFLVAITRRAIECSPYYNSPVSELPTRCLVLYR